MKFSQVALLSFGCVLALLMIEVSGQFGYGGAYYLPYYSYGNQGSSWGNGGFLVLIGAIFIIIVLFSGFNRNTSSSSSFSIVNLTDDDK